MINFLSDWIEQIAIAVIIVSIFELILPKGNLKKYINQTKKPAEVREMFYRPVQNDLNI